ncbi:MAG: hypothetical protein M1829_000763 [Trizodia sp. TS-e1964]|nr:MAG: hypothetical protein M1829_000763 [Trizodia sp. TS-e1964]
MPPPSSPTRLTVLISGTGTNLRALISATNTPDLPSVAITHVLSNRAAAPGLALARAAAIPTTVHALLPYKRTHPPTEDGVQAARSEYDAELARLVLADSPHLVVCAGWMHILSEQFLRPLEEGGVPVVNLHPALPGQFDGAGAIRRAWEAFGRGEVRGSGVMMHYVVREVDRGEPVLVREVGMREGEELAEFERRVREVEWEVVVEGTRLAIQRLRAGEPEAGGT